MLQVHGKIRTGPSQLRRGAGRTIQFATPSALLSVNLLCFAPAELQAQTVAPAPTFVQNVLETPPEINNPIRSVLVSSRRPAVLERANELRPLQQVTPGKPSPPPPPEPVPVPRPSASASPVEPSPAEVPPPQAALGAAPSTFLPKLLPIGQLNIDIRPKARDEVSDLPKPMPLSDAPGLESVPSARGDELLLYPTLAAPPSDQPSIYRPLYFEEVNLERYGRAHGYVQPAISAARFFGTVPLLPYAVARRHPRQTYSWQWPYPSGAPAPRVKELPPFSPKAAAVEAGAVTGLLFAIP